MRFRPRFQRCFMMWLDRVRSHLAIQPQVIRRTDSEIRIQFKGISRTIEASIRRCGHSYSIDVLVMIADGISIDSLFSSRISVHRTDAGYTDENEAEGSSPPRERCALWQDRLFDPFLTWINTDLATADSLCIFREGRMHDGSPVPAETLMMPWVLTEEGLSHPSGSHFSSFLYAQLLRSTDATDHPFAYLERRIPLHPE